MTQDVVIGMANAAPTVAVALTLAPLALALSVIAATGVSIFATVAAASGERSRVRAAHGTVTCGLHQIPLPTAVRTATDAPDIAEPKHPLHAMTTYELRDRRRELEHAINGAAPDAPIQALLRAQLADVADEEQDRRQIAEAPVPVFARTFSP